MPSQEALYMYWYQLKSANKNIVRNKLLLPGIYILLVTQFIIISSNASTVATIQFKVDTQMPVHTCTDTFNACKHSELILLCKYSIA